MNPGLSSLLIWITGHKGIILSCQFPGRLEKPNLQKKVSAIVGGMWSVFFQMVFEAAEPLKLRKKSSLSAHRILHSLKSNRQFAHENRLSQKDGLAFQPSIFRRELLVARRVMGGFKKKSWVNSNITYEVQNILWLFGKPFVWLKNAPRTKSPASFSGRQNGATVTYRFRGEVCPWTYQVKVSLWCNWSIGCTSYCHIPHVELTWQRQLL